MKKFIPFLAIFVLCTLLAHSGISQDASSLSSDIVTITGTIQRFSREGGFYGIKGDDDMTYKPLRLSQGFEVEGLRVKATLRIIKKKFLFHAWATPVEILGIERYRN